MELAWQKDEAGDFVAETEEGTVRVRIGGDPGRVVVQRAEQAWRRCGGSRSR